MFETLRPGADGSTSRRGSISRPWPTDSARYVATRQPGGFPRRSRGRPGPRHPLPDHIGRDRACIHPPMPRSITPSRFWPLRKRSNRGRSENEEEDERLPTLRAVARAEFGRAGLRGHDGSRHCRRCRSQRGSVYRLIGSKDGSCHPSCAAFTVKARRGMVKCSRSDGTAVEKLDALMWININAVVRFSDEYNIQLAWIRESPPNTTNLGSSFSARLSDLKSLLAQGIRSGRASSRRPDRRTSAPGHCSSSSGCLRTSFDKLGPRGALTLARETTLRGAAHRP